MNELEQKTKIEELLEQVEEIKKLPKKILKGFWFVFICLTIGVFGKYAFQANWANGIIDFSIITITILLTYIKHKMKKKEKEDEL